MMSEESEAYRRREVLRYLESLGQEQRIDTAEWLADLESHPGWQALVKDPEWTRITAEGQKAIEQDKQDRAIFEGRYWDELSEAERAKCEELDVALDKQLFPLKRALVQLQMDFSIPSRPSYIPRLKTIAAIRVAIAQCQRSWIEADSLYRKIAHLDVVEWWNSARLIKGAPAVPPMPPPFPQPCSDLQEALVAADVLLRWCDQVEPRHAPATPASNQATGNASGGLSSAGEIAALCDDFIRHVDSYLLWENLKSPPHQAGTLEGVLLGDFGATSADYEVRRTREGLWLRKNGPALADALVRHAFDSSVVLRLALDVEDPDNGPSTVRTKWKDAKVTLQQVALQLRYGKPMTSNGPPAVTRVASEGNGGTDSSLPPYSESEPVLKQDDYQRILEILRSMSVHIERNPSTFAALDEEGIRNHFLLQLNGQFKGGATGETVNGAGKTDILIRVRDRNIFIAECKFWYGQEKFGEAIDQLLSYLTWRDCKCALLIFNRNKDTTAVAQKIHEIMQARTEHRQTLAHDLLGDSQYIFVKADDPDREILITTQLFDVPRN